MTLHQPGIFHDDAAHHIFLEFVARRHAPALPGGALAAAPLVDGRQVIAFGAKLLERLALVAAPPGMADFTPIRGRGGQCAPATARDLFIWLQGARRDELFARAMAWRDVLAGHADLAGEEHGFRFRDSRDLTGFVDGSANPKADARLDVALIRTGEHAGGSFVLAQRWVHDLTAFNKLAVADQERVIGRTKADSVELVGTAMPPDSHVSRTDIKRGGEGVKIYRRSSPVGTLRDAGLYFLAFSAELNRFRQLLESMYGRTEDGVQDRLLSFSKPKAGSYFYAPPQAALQAAFSE